MNENLRYRLQLTGGIAFVLAFAGVLEVHLFYAFGVALIYLIMVDVSVDHFSPKTSNGVSGILIVWFMLWCGSLLYATFAYKSMEFLAAFMGAIFALLAAVVSVSDSEEPRGSLDPAATSM